MQVLELRYNLRIMEREVLHDLPYVLIGMFVLGVLLFLVSLYLLRLRRTGSYWRMRRKAGDRGGKLFLISVGLIVGSLVLTVIVGIVSLTYRNSDQFLDRGPDNLYGIVLPPDVIMTATHDALIQASFTAITPLTATPIPATTAAPTPTQAPATLTEMASATLTALAASATMTNTAASPTETPQPSSTPTPTFEALLNLTPSFNVTPRPAPTTDFRLALDAAADNLGADGKAPAAQQEFPAGIQRIYFYISFDQMVNGVAWSRVLLRDNVAVQGDTLLWSLGAAGNSYFFFGNQTGYLPGSYEVRLFVGNRQMSRYTFDVKAT